jgi:hypothetical protein
METLRYLQNPTALQLKRTKLQMQLLIRPEITHKHAYCA